MYERMLKKEIEPSLEEIKEYLGKSYTQLIKLEDILKEQYNLSREIKFPFGGSYGWGYKYSNKSTHLFYAFFEKNAFTVTIQIGDKQVPKLEEIIYNLTAKSKELWKNRYPCGDNGGWIHYRIVDDNDIKDIVKFINIKKAPIFKIAK